MFHDFCDLDKAVLIILFSMLVSFLTISASIAVSVIKFDSNEVCKQIKKE